MKAFAKRYSQPGTAPGTLADTGINETTLRLHIIEYDRQNFEEIIDGTLDQCRRHLDTPTITWIHVHGAASANTLKTLGTAFGLHHLALEDVINTGQRAKADYYENQLFVVLHKPYFNGQTLSTSQFSFFLGREFVVSFDDGQEDPFEPLRQRLRTEGHRSRESSSDYLLYLMLDIIIDSGYPVLEAYGEHIETLEHKLLSDPAKSTLNRIHGLKRELLILRRTLWPQREVINGLLRGDYPLISDPTKLYLRDCYDHCIQIIDLLETYRDMTSGMLEVYLSSVSLKLNEVMRVLAVISAVFLPMSFIAGIYGMNFHATSPWNMPELDWIYGYPFALGLMLSLGCGLLWLFHRRGWL